MYEEVGSFLRLDYRLRSSGTMGDDFKSWAASRGSIDANGGTNDVALLSKQHSDLCAAFRIDVCMGRFRQSRSFQKIRTNR